MPIELSEKVAIVTGAGAGIGRAHALALASRGARVVVNDLDFEAACETCARIGAAGGEAMAHAANVTRIEEVRAMVEAATERWNKVDVLINNAGILRDRTFAKMDLEEFRLVVEVHLMGSVNCTKVVWDGMRERNYGRIVFTTSSSGLYGNFGQSNYSAAKMALVGLMQTLALEGEKHNIRVNCLAPSAATAMTSGIYAKGDLPALDSRMVSPVILALASPEAPTRRIILAGAGSFEQANVTMTRGVYLGAGEHVADDLLARIAELANREGELIPENGAVQYLYELERARRVAEAEIASASQ